jgi:(R,R)-butanediol dehydrogenase/meso-butanediol dehydrogenase/diacetyl reductase
MKALRFHAPRDLRLEMVPRPGKPAGNEVKVRVEAAGICGTDLHVFETGAYVTKAPVIMGHEFAGLVLEAGDGAKGLEPGDRVVGDSRSTCGVCDFCRGGHPNLCDRLGFIGEVRDGAFAEEILIEEPSLLRIDPSVPAGTAALAEPLAVAVHAAGLAGAGTLGRRTLVLGAGPVGALLYEILLLKELPDILVADRSPYRRGVVERVHPGSTGEPSGRYDVVFETTGSPGVAESLLPRVVQKRGTLVMVGLYRGPVPFDLNALIESEWRVFGCAAFSNELVEAVHILETRWPVFSHVASHVFPLSGYREAFDLLLSPQKNAMKILFQPGLE